MARHGWRDGQLFQLPFFGFRICMSGCGVLGIGKEANT